MSGGGMAPRGRTVVLALLGGLSLAGWHPVRAQEPLRAGFVGSPRVGRDAPDFSLPYHTASGPGPADQPFHLRAELGRVVVLVFAETPGDSVSRSVFEFLTANDQSLFNPATVMVGLFRTGPVAVQDLAASLGSRFKFLPDSLGRAFRRFGVARGGAGSGGASVFVVGYDGRLVYRASGFRPGSASDVEKLRKAVQEGTG